MSTGSQFYSPVRIPQSEIPEMAPGEDTDDRVLNSLLRMGTGYRRSGALNQAIELFWSLLEKYPDTPQGQLAKENLLGICEEYERDGKLRQARAMYQRLL